MSGGQSWEEAFSEEEPAAAGSEEESASCPLCLEELVRATNHALAQASGQAGGEERDRLPHARLLRVLTALSAGVWLCASRRI
jgi:hypothetical protein